MGVRWGCGWSAAVRPAARLSRLENDLIMFRPNLPLCWIIHCVHTGTSKYCGEKHQAPLGRSQHWQCKWLVNNPIRKQSAAAGEPHITISATNRVKLISHTKLTFGQRQTDRNARYLAIPIQSTACIKMVFVLDFLI